MTEVYPGLIDPHVHLREMDDHSKEDTTSGTEAAAAGGYTTILDMHNGTQPTFSPITLKRKISIMENKDKRVNVGLHLGLVSYASINIAGIENDFFGFKIFMDPSTNNLQVNDINYLRMDIDTFVRAQGANPSHPIIFHAEGSTGSLEKAINLIQGTSTYQPFHIAHVSTRSELEMIMQAKKDGLNLTCEVSAHHLFLTKAKELQLGSFAKMRPPLAKDGDKAFLRDHLDSIDMIASDHAPHTRHDKLDTDLVVNGVPGLDTTLPMLLTAKAEGWITRNRIIEMTSINPAKRFRVKTRPNTYTIVDPDIKYTLTSHLLRTKCGWSPFEGMELTGQVLQTYLNSQLIYDHGKFIGEPIGKIVYPN